MLLIEADIKVTWIEDTEYRGKGRNMKKKRVVMSWGRKEQDEEYSRPIFGLVEMKLLGGFVWREG